MKMETNNYPIEAPRRRPPPPPPPRPASRSFRKPPPVPRKKFQTSTPITQITPIFELPAEPVGGDHGPFEISNNEFDEHLEQALTDLVDGNVQAVPLEYSVASTNDVLDESLPSTSSLEELAYNLRLPLACRHCQKKDQAIQELVYCQGCKHSFHEACWSQYTDHVENPCRLEPCRRYTNLERHIWVSYLHSSQDEEVGLLKELLADRPHRWIGTSEIIGREPDLDEAELLLYPALMRQFNGFDVTPGVSETASRKQFPRLVAFFGDTGTGKSTIIKNLIRHLTSSKEFSVPIVGSRAEAQNSTSGGVHLYTDPKTFSDPRPIVYVDCEGLRGDLNPIANQVESRIQKAKLGKLRKPPPKGSRLHGSQRHHPGPIEPDFAQDTKFRREWESKPEPISKMPLPWAEQASKPWRNIVSAKIYPRFLYVFSDVVCYVTGNSRAAEEDMAQLVDWAHDAHDYTTNQGVKPGLLYIINQDNNADLRKWSNIEYATKAILEKLRNSKRFAKEQELWRNRGRTVNSADQLLRCYYSSVKVVFIPQFLPSNPSCEADEIWGQYSILHREIMGLSWSSSEHRREARVLFDLEALSRHSVGILQQLAKNHESSVDLRKLAEPAQPYPVGFIGHVLNVLSRFQEVAPKDRRTNHQDIGSEVSLIRKIFRYVASCIAGEIRRTAPGSGSVPEQIELYSQKWRQILEEFSRTHCRCEEVYHGQRCVNYRMSHVKGHQFNTKGPERVRHGEFVSRFIQALDKLQEEVSDQLPQFLNSLSDVEWSRELWYTSKSCAVNKIFSNRTCLVCLHRTPIHSLPCNHHICDVCATTFNSEPIHEKRQTVIQRCPLGCDWNFPKWTLRRKPAEAGVRILTLDDGGVRGVIQRTILQDLILRVGHDIPIQELFDVIVGTGSGGMISLGIFRQGWTMSEAKNKFEQVLKEAFSKRSMLKLLWPLPGGHLSAQMMLRHLYKSTGIDNILQVVFGNTQTLFGDIHELQRHTNKVAVAAVTELGAKPILLCNYNRDWLSNDNDNNNLARAEKPREELRTWEAARCTTAIPTYFESYRHPTTNREYFSSILECSNPVKIADSERAFLWPNSSENSRDLILSLGTGYSSNFAGDIEPEIIIPEALKPLGRRGLLEKLAMLRLVKQSTGACESLWKDFRASLSDDKHLLTKCHRVNIPYGQGQTLCKLDDVAKIESTEAEAAAFLHQKSRSCSPDIQTRISAQLDTIARQLTASLFYFELEDVYDLNEYTYHCKGRLRCRLDFSFTPQMRSLLGREPRFRLHDEENPGGNTMSLGQHWNLDDFSISASFDGLKHVKEGVRIEASLDNGKYWDDISGFPRRLQKPKSS